MLSVHPATSAPASPSAPTTARHAGLWQRARARQIVSAAALTVALLLGSAGAALAEPVADAFGFLPAEPTAAAPTDPVVTKSLETMRKLDTAIAGSDLDTPERRKVWDAAAIQYGTTINVADLESAAAVIAELDVPDEITPSFVARVDQSLEERGAWLKTIFARDGNVTFYAPDATLVGFHQSGSPAARSLNPSGTAPKALLGDRGRGTDLRSAADVAVPHDTAVVSPVTGTVAEARPYSLYGKTTDELVTIRPDDDRNRQVRVLHLDGLKVQPGSRVVGGKTKIADRARLLPFDSQIDVQVGRVPHYHVEVR